MTACRAGFGKRRLFEFCEAAPFPDGMDFCGAAVIFFKNDMR